RWIGVSAVILFFITFFVVQYSQDLTHNNVSFNNLPAEEQIITSADVNTLTTDNIIIANEQEIQNIPENNIDIITSAESIPFITIQKENLNTDKKDIVVNTTITEGVKENKSVNSETAKTILNELNNNGNTAVINSNKREDDIRTYKDLLTTTKSIKVNSTIPVTDDQAIKSLALSPIDEKHSRYFDESVSEENLKQTYYKDLESYSPQINLKGMSFGIAASYNQTSLLEDGNIFKGEKPIQPALKFGASKGVTLGYNFSNKFGMQVDYIYNSVQGQNYVMSEEDQLIQKTLALYYNQVPVTFKLKVPRISDLTQKPVVTNYIAGIQYGMLKEYHIPQEKLYSDPDAIFKKSEISFMLGIDYDIYLSKRSYLSLGARTSISNDISTHLLPFDDFSKRNFVFGLRGSFNYMFREY
ncbi:MAG: outer membrane beta-barrel protein, partial [Fimbriimonadaceae bacterium]|nr:outer membrane beta-barrel protein [Chitinophagales bacterium]